MFKWLRKNKQSQKPTEMINGPHTITDARGNVYTGVFKYSQKYGLFNVKMTDGRDITGNFFMDRPNSEFEIKYPDGRTYKGEVNYNLNEHGYGKMMYQDGHYEKGEWRDGQFHHGTIYYSNGKTETYGAEKLKQIIDNYSKLNPLPVLTEMSEETPMFSVVKKDVLSNSIPYSRSETPLRPMPEEPPMFSVEPNATSTPYHGLIKSSIGGRKTHKSKRNKSKKSKKSNKSKKRK